MQHAARPVQYFSKDYLERCRSMNPGEILEFLEGFRLLHLRGTSASRLISMKVPTDLLELFKRRAGLEGVPYQTQIKRLMRQWLGEISAETARNP